MDRTKNLVVSIMLLFLSMGSIDFAYAEHFPTATKGLLNLRYWNFDAQGSVQMQGEWEFYWKKFYDGNNIDLGQDIKPDAYLSVPNVWNGLVLADGTTLQGPGFATLRLRILLPATISDGQIKFLRIYVRPIDSPYAMQVFDNTGKPLSELTHSGDLLQDTELVIPAKNYQDFPVRSATELIVIWRISNYRYYAYAGPWRVPELGKETNIISKLKTNRSIDFLLIGITLAVGLYHWILYLLRPRDYETFWFGSFCLCIAFVVLYVNEYIGDFLGNELDYENPQRLLVSIINIDIFSLILFVRNIIPRYAKNKLSIIIAGPSIFYIFAVWVFPFNEAMFGFFTLFLPIHHALVILWVTYIGLYAFYKETNIMNFLFLSGVSALSITNIHAMLVALQVIQDRLYLHAGLIIFIIMQAITIARKNQHAHIFSEQLAADIKLKSDELAQQNRMLELQAKELTRMDQLKDAFLANTSHELKTPLNGIIGLTQSLFDKHHLYPDQRHNLDLITYSAKRLYNLVNDILDFSKIRHRDIRLDLKPVDLKTVADIVLTTSAPLVGTKRVELINRIPTQLPSALADEDRLQQILFNLVDNAIKFTLQGEIVISAEQEGEYIRILVKDTGIGIPEEEQSHIFEAFEQASRSSADTYGGTGLGLTIAKQLVELQQGTMIVESTENQGTLFAFTLPIHAEPSRSPSFELTPFSARFIEPSPGYHLPSNDDANHEQGNRGKATILIVDDEPINVQLIGSYLSSTGHEIWVAANGLAALEILQTKKPDLIIMDLMMPLMNGFETTQKIRRNYLLTQLPIIILTVRNRLSDLTAGLRSGANDYLLKPFHKEELLARIQTHLNMARIKSTIEKFVPVDFLRHLEKESILDIRLGDNVEREMSVLFSDIRSFSSFAESVTSEQLFSFINFYLSKMGPIVRQHGGFIDQYIGDAIVALFGNHADHALQSAIDMLVYLHAHNETKKANTNHFPIKIGIGLHSGKLRLGAIGETHRIQGGVVGDAVNLASRLQELTKVYKAPLLISEYTFNCLQDTNKYTIRSVGNVKVKGRNEIVGVLEVLDGEDPTLRAAKIATETTFQTGIALFREKNFEQAKKLFERCYKQCPEDGVAKVYFDSCIYYLSADIDPEKWEVIPYLEID